MIDQAKVDRDRLSGLDSQNRDARAGKLAILKRARVNQNATG